MNNMPVNIDFSEYVSLPFSDRDCGIKEYSAKIPDLSCFFYDSELCYANLMTFICIFLTHFSERKKTGFFLKCGDEYIFAETDTEGRTVKQAADDIYKAVNSKEIINNRDTVNEYAMKYRLPVFEIVSDTEAAEPAGVFTVFMAEDMSVIRISGNTGTGTEKFLELCAETVFEYGRNYDNISDSEISSLRIMSIYEKELLESFNHINQNYDDEAEHIISLLKKQCEISSDETAIEFSDETVTYSEFFSRAKRYAYAFRKRGMKCGDTAAMYVEYSADMVCIMTAVWMCGAAYIPIAKDFPDERLRYVLSDSGASFVITDTYSAAFEGMNIITAEECRESDTELEELSISPDNKAYIIYTSGSTGKPKGVFIGHRSLAAMMRATRSVFPVDENDSVISVTTCSFDIFATEIFWPLIAGARLIIASSDERSDPQKINKKIKFSACNVFQTTPSRIKWMQMCGADSCLRQIDKLLCAGERFSPELLKKLRRIPGMRIFNGYGPTETTIYSSISELTDRNDPVVGSSLSDYGYLILDDSLEPVNTGVIGQLCIYGKGLAECYINNQKLTDEKFIYHPLVGGKIYLTGDLARWNVCGEAEIVGRNDFQIKVNGYRVELGDIEAVTEDHPDIKNAAAAAFDDEGVKRIAVVYTGDCTLTKQELVDYYSLKLPAYMIPSLIIYTDSIPMNLNGKTDAAEIRKIIRSYSEKKRQDGV